MPITGTPLTSWLSSIAANRYPRRLAVTVRMTMDEESALAFDTMATPGFFEDVLVDLFNTEFVSPGGVLFESYHKHANNPSAYYPKFIARESIDDDQDVDAAGYGRSRDARDESLRIRKPKKIFRGDVPSMREGFKALWQDIATMRRGSNSSMAVVGLGPWQEILSHKLSTYSRTPGATSTSPLNTLFYAVEYGTGVKDNVGGPQWVRTVGPTKADDPPGSWWLGAKRPDGGWTGLQFTGQKGFHFLYEERSRIPHDIYRKRLLETFPSYVRKHLAAARQSAQPAGAGAE